MGGGVTDWIPWFALALNLTGCFVMAKFGLPREFPLLGREDGDPILGLAGLVIFGTSIAIRISTIIFVGR